MIYEIPLTKTSGKIRIKERQTFADYGLSIAPTKTKITHKHYIEWQIGYDKVVNKSEKFDFIGANGKAKVLYELSEFIKFGYKSGIILKETLENLILKIDKNCEFIDALNITRTNFIDTKIGEIKFLKSSVSYPLLIYKFASNDEICEIVVKEKQYASGIMPMLYFCLSLSKIDENFLGREIKSGEMAKIKIGEKNLPTFLKIIEIFGILSPSHKHDTLEILKAILR